MSIHPGQGGWQNIFLPNQQIQLYKPAQDLYGLGYE